MPVYLRRFYFNKLLEQKKIEKKQMDHQRKDDPGRLYKKDDLVWAMWADGKEYEGIIRKYNRKEKKYDVMFDNEEWDFVEEKDIKPRAAKQIRGGNRLKFKF